MPLEGLYEKTYETNWVNDFRGISTKTVYTLVGGEGCKTFSITDENDTPGYREDKKYYLIKEEKDAKES